MAEFQNCVCCIFLRKGMCSFYYHSLATAASGFISKVNFPWCSWKLRICKWIAVAQLPVRGLAVRGFQRLFFLLPSLFPWWFILVPLKVLLSRLLAFLDFPAGWEPGLFCFLLVLLPTCCEGTPPMKHVSLDGVSGPLHCRWQFSNWYFASH